MTILTGIIYPLIMTGTAQLIYHSKANGSLIMRDGKVIGSDLIGQNFDSIIYFWSRPSVIGYNPVPSGASNYGPVSDTLRKLVASRIDLFARANSINNKPDIPKEMIFASGSGLDPHISKEAALLQVDRVSDARHLSSSQKEKLIEEVKEMTETPQFLFLGQERVNVLKLNIELNKIAKNN
jgi:potassium-transporting ATPase KdpC subunit